VGEHRDQEPRYSDVLYVEELIARDVINTMPEATLRAFADHGDATRAFDDRAAGAAQTLADAERRGLDIGAITAELEREGVRSFCDSCHELLSCIETKLARDELAGARNQSRR